MSLQSEIIDRAEMGVVDPGLIRKFAGGTNRAQSAAEASRERCLRYRRRVLEISQRVSALHIGGAFSCTEILDTIHNHLMCPGDTFLLSKGHAGIMQYVVTHSGGALDLNEFCTRGGLFGTHPDRQMPGVAAASGSLGHGLGMALGMALAERHDNPSATIYVVLSDGEMQEGSTWEAIMLASSLRASNIVAVIDNNDRQSLGRTSETHPSFYPIVEKLQAFGWESSAADGHNFFAIADAITHRGGISPFALSARTIKGKGVSFMEDVPVWHYRSPNPDEYRQAMRELGDVA